MRISDTLQWNQVNLGKIGDLGEIAEMEKCENEMESSFEERNGVEFKQSNWI